MKTKVLYWALGVVFTLNALLIWNAMNQESIFPDYLFKPQTNDSELVEQEQPIGEQENHQVIQELPKKEVKMVMTLDSPSVAKENLVTRIETEVVSGDGFIEVESGQTLALLARKYQVTVDQIKAENGLGSDVLQVGMKLKMPKKGIKTESPNGQLPLTVIHIVQSGETLNKIAKKYGIDVDRIRQANQIENDIINSGQKLTIPK